LEQHVICGPVSDSQYAELSQIYHRGLMPEPKQWYGPSYGDQTDWWRVDGPVQSVVVTIRVQNGAGALGIIGPSGLVDGRWDRYVADLAAQFADHLC
jgi:hypothetical protein